MEMRHHLFSGGKCWDKTNLICFESAKTSLVFTHKLTLGAFGALALRSNNSNRNNPMNVKILYLFIQKTYAHEPAVGESHLHLMNSLNCPLTAAINGSEFSRIVELNSSSNHVFYDLKSSLDLDLNFRVSNENCPDVNLVSEKSFHFKTADQRVRIGLKDI